MCIRDSSQADEDQLAVNRVIGIRRDSNVKCAICGLAKNDDLLCHIPLSECLIYKIEEEWVAADMDDVLPGLVPAKSIDSGLILECDLASAIQDKDCFLDQIEVSKSLLNVHNTVLFDLIEITQLSTCI